MCHPPIDVFVVINILIEGWAHGSFFVFRIYTSLSTLSECPLLPVVSAGSLLEFALDDNDESLPVGRVSCMYLHPLSFVEFLWAVGEERIAEYLKGVRSSLEISNAIHEKCLELFRLYCIIGGMPEVVNKWNATHNLTVCSKVHKDLVATYRDDFNKYRKSVSADVLRKVMESFAYQIGSNYVYSSVDRDIRQPIIKSAVDKLEKAGLCKRIYCSSGNGIPLGAEKNERIFKAVFLDSGLVMSVLGLQPLNSEQLKGIVWSNKGAFAEQVCGQLLISLHSQDNDDLFFWQQSGSGNGEIDYLIQQGTKVIPVEVKSGVSGSMKSLHGFMQSKHLMEAIRFDLNQPSLQSVSVKTNQGHSVFYRLLSLPLYMVEFIYG
jgi:predicted AAA+ superfamily ATPase